MKRIVLHDVFATGEAGELVVLPTALAEWTRQRLKLLPVLSLVKGPVLYRYQGGCYLPCSKEYLLGYMKDAISRIDLNLAKMSKLREALELLYASGDYIPLENLDRDEGVIVFENGVLPLDTRLPLLQAHVPELLVSIQMPCQWKAEPEPTPVFDRYLRSLSGGDLERELFLLRWIGLCLSNVLGWKTKRVLFMVGEGDAGAQLLRLVERLLGREHCAGLDFEGLETFSGVKSLYGKRLAGSVAMGHSSHRELKVFQRVMGGDLLDLGRGESFTYQGVFWFCSRKFPELKSKEDHQAIGQMIPFPCQKAPTDDISEALFKERAGIVSRAVRAYREILAEGYDLPEPRSVFEFREKLLGNSSTVIRFIETCMEPRIGGKVKKGEATTGGIYRVYCNWCVRTGEKKEVNLKGFEEVVERYSRCNHDDLITRRGGNSFFLGFKLTEEAQAQFLVKASYCGVDNVNII